jgi:hypothetical protein
VVGFIEKAVDFCVEFFVNDFSRAVMLSLWQRLISKPGYKLY